MALDAQDIKALRPDALSPAEIEAKAETISIGKTTMSIPKMFALAIMAGLFIGCGATLFTLVQGDAELPFAISRVFGAACFSVGLMLVVCCGAELFTGNTLMICGVGSKKINWGGMMKNWVVVWIGNLVGSVLLAFLVYMSAMAAMNGGLVGDAMVNIANSKVSLAPETIFCKGILCNFLVCLGVWMSFAGRTIVDKIVCVIMPITAFVACGFEHCVANMFFLFMGFFAKLSGYGSSVDASALDISGIFYNLTFATLGNIVGGMVMVGLIYWFVYHKKND